MMQSNILSTNIIGAIGYSILNKKQIKIMVIADMHKLSEKCGDIFISEWLKRQHAIKLLLEEVPVTDTKLKELWSDAPHTKKLRELYLNNLDKIVGLDIRGELLDFSWELLEEMKFENIKLVDYLKYLELFFSFRHPFLKQNLPNIYKKDIINNETLIGQHFDKLQKQYYDFKIKNKEYLNKFVQDIYNSNKDILEQINLILNSIMEFYTIMQIYNCALLGNKKIIIHKGLFHTSNLKAWLTDLYKFDLLDDNGLTEFDKIDKIKHTGCLKMPEFI